MYPKGIIIECCCVLLGTVLHEVFHPVKAFFRIPFQASLSFVVHVHVNPSVPFLHLSRGQAYQVDAAPHGIAQNRYPIQLNRILNSLKMVLQVIDPVIIL